ncbi:uncharacterized protein TNCV_2952491 [Trichonephila clavipes]|nr:uncharacterized protein TNCV_2952491 [Trichonephila clavipes]
MKEGIAVVEEKVGKEIEKIKEQVEERIEGVAENFSLISQRMENLEKKLLAGRNENKSKSVPVSAFPEPVLASPVPVTAYTGPVKLLTYDGKTNWEIYKTQFSIIFEANGWTEGAKACQLAASLRGEAAEVLQTLPDTEQLNFCSLYNAMDLRFGQKYSKDYACLQMKTRLQKIGESLQEYAYEVERLANLAFSEPPSNCARSPLPRSSDGNNNILVVMNYFTKWPEAYPSSDQEASTVAEALVQHWISRFWVPLQLHSDQGRNFDSAVCKRLCEILAIDKTRTTALHLQTKAW